MSSIIEQNEALEQQLITQIQLLRAKQGISQSELARRTGVPQKTISRMENGLSVPALSTLHRLVKAMGYNLTFAITEQPKNG